MQDVSKIEGPSGPPESHGKRDKAAVDAEKFKEAMRRRVTEVSQVDPDEQKKRKRREEAEEEEPITEGPATPPSQVAPFSLEEPEKKVSPMGMEGKGISPLESSKKAMMASPPSPAYLQTPSAEEMEDDSGLLEEESFIETFPSPPERAPPPTFRETMTPSAPPQAEQPPQPVERRPEATPPPTERRRRVPAETAAEKGITAPELEGVKPSKVESKGFFEQLKKEEKAEEEAELQGAAPAPPPPPAAPIPELKKEEKVEEKGLEMGGMPAALGEMPGPPVLPPAPETLPAYANLHPQVMEIFDRMVGVMTVMTMSGMTETTITLNAPQFASSVFFGSQIIIREFSTAPRAFNIQLNGTPQAVALFQGNIDDLMAAFSAGNYNFRVNRLETGYLTERPLFKRKEKAGGKEKDTGDSPQ